MVGVAGREREGGGAEGHFELGDYACVGGAIIHTAWMAQTGKR